MVINSKLKGKIGELELANILKEYGYEAKRGQQYCGIKGDADIVGIPGYHIECKRTEKLNIYNAMDQAIKDAKDQNIPVVIHRKNRHNWLVTMNLEDWIMLIKGK